MGSVPLSALLGLFLVLGCPGGCPGAQAQYIEIPHQEVENWAWRFGHHLYELGKKITYLEDMAKQYSSRASLSKVDGMSMVHEMVNDIERMMASKVQAVQRITETAEQAMKGHVFDKHLKHEFLDAKTINSVDGFQIPMTPNKRFENIPVNVNHSTIHVATNVYDQAANVQNAIKWSEYLTPTFISNYEYDPSSLWQYFGSATGFLRHFPGVQLLSKDKNEEDNYDCRMRPWYIEAASSPKDVVVLLDTSGSMTGLRKEIAKQVVVNILETLTHNDFVAVLKFSDDVENVVECFEDKLVPANKENIEVIKEHLNIGTDNIANFTKALITAFELIVKYNISGESTQCNQALMIITDGAPYMFDDIFRTYNQPHQRIRVFTYLIGREVTEKAEVINMACANRGYFTHVTTLAEVKEQVEKYIPVMARPMVIQQQRNYIWTPVYADISDPKISKWLFEMRERAKKKARILRKMRLIADEGPIEEQHVDEFPDGPSAEEREPDPWTDEEWSPTQDKYVDVPVEQHQLMTSVAAPVFDLQNVKITTEKVLINGTLVEQTREDRQASLLGVAGTDVPVRDILKLAPPFKVGVNGYPFIVTNNGHLLYHPDLRPMFEGLLKLDYSSVDVAEVELGEDTFVPWAKSEPVMNSSYWSNSSDWSNDTDWFDCCAGWRDLDIQLRRELIDRKTGTMNFAVKVHMDNMKRVVTRTNKYFFAPLANSPFTFALAMPDGYGETRIKAFTDVKSAKFNVVSVFDGNKWRVHPDWVYCNYYFPATHPQRSPEENLHHFLQHIQNHKQAFKEKFQRVKYPLSGENDFSQKNFNIKDKNEFFCDRELIQSIIFDAEVTDVFGKKSPSPLDTQGHATTGFARKNGVTLTFVATRSGLTRWEDLLPEEELGNQTEPHFIHLHTRAIDEVWYKRAVDQYLINNTSFVFSVPFDAARRNDTVVTGSHAIFVESAGQKAPAAVVGLQFKHSIFAETFMNFTSTCSLKSNCATNCSSEELDCYLLDDNGFVIVSEHYHDTGRFFGEVDGLIMHSLIVDGIYQSVQMYDFQAVCKEDVNLGNAASYLTRPLQHITWTLHWLWKKVALMWLQYNVYSWWNNDWLVAASDENPVNQYIDRFEMKKKRMRPCNTNFTLYRLNTLQLKLKPLKAKLIKCNPNGCDRPFSVQQVPYTNLVLLAVDATCPCESSQTTSITPVEVKLMVNETEDCRIRKIAYYRKRPDKCFDYHPEELLIKDCGRGSGLRASIALLLTGLAVVWGATQRLHQAWS